MEVIEQSVEVEQPLSVVYDQWTQFESFPCFMESIVEVSQTDDKRLHWKAVIAGREKEWDAEIFEQTPDQRIAWRSMDGVKNSGAVNFAEISPELTRVTVHMSYEPEGIIENLAGMLGFAVARVTDDLQRFKEFIEARGTASGAWRGEIHGRNVLPETGLITNASTPEGLPQT